jgi:hypothetical protein
MMGMGVFVRERRDGVLIALNDLMLGYALNKIGWCI